MYGFTSSYLQSGKGLPTYPRTKLRIQSLLMRTRHITCVLYYTRKYQLKCVHVASNQKHMFMMFFYWFFYASINCQWGITLLLWNKKIIKTKTKYWMRFRISNGINSWKTFVLRTSLFIFSAKYQLFCWFWKIIIQSKKRL